VEFSKENRQHLSLTLYFDMMTGEKCSWKSLDFGHPNTSAAKIDKTGNSSMDEHIILAVAKAVGEKLPVMSQEVIFVQIST